MQAISTERKRCNSAKHGIPASDYWGTPTSTDHENPKEANREEHANKKIRSKLTTGTPG
jgi:hypothetical protein